MSYGSSEDGRIRQNARAAIFVDYENIYHTLNEKPEHSDDAWDVVSEMLEALKRSLLEERGTWTAVARAYADFTDLNGTGDLVQRALYLQGVESRFVPASLQVNAAELQLCIDAMDMLYNRADVDTYVVLTGRRRYLPLIQHLKRFGKRVLVAAMEDPASLDHARDMDGGWFFDARDLLSSGSRRTHGPDAKTSSGAQNGSSGSSMSDRTIADPTLIRTLEIINEHFGHYEEVYLTPLLRKLSEVFDEPTCDPKSLVSDLEQHAAVRLEKRQGFPHDYTVLIVNRDHQDVARVLQVVGEADPYYYDDVSSFWDEDGSDDFGEHDRPGTSDAAHLDAVRRGDGFEYDEIESTSPEEGLDDVETSGDYYDDPSEEG